MPTAINNNLKELISANRANDKVNTSSDQKFDNQKRQIYLYKAFNFYGTKRANINSYDNQRFLWSIRLFKKLTCYIMNENKLQKQSSFNVLPLGSDLQYDVTFDENIETENYSFILSFNEIKEDTPLESIFYISNINNLYSDNKEIDYSYTLDPLTTMSLGNNSYIKLLTHRIKKNKKVVSAQLELLNLDAQFLGFDANLKGQIDNVLPVWSKILNVDNNTIDYRNLWENNKWLIPWEELDEKRKADKIKLTDLLTQNGAVFTPAINIIKKVVALNTAYIRRFNGTTEVETAQIGQNVGQFWKEQLDGKTTAEASAILTSYIDDELKLWRNGQYRGKIESNYPFGNLTPFPPDNFYSQDIIERTLSILTMLSLQVVSAYAFFNGRSEAVRVLLPYYFLYDETQSFYDTNINLEILDLDELIIQSNYFILKYPFFNEAQIKEYNETGDVSTYIVKINSENPEKKYGPLNPYLRVGDKAVETKNYTFYGSTQVAASNSAFGTGSGDVYGWGNNPLILAITNIPTRRRWERSELEEGQWRAVSVSYSRGTFNDGDAGSVVRLKFSNTTQIAAVSFNDVIKSPNIFLGYVEDGGPNPSSEKIAEINFLGSLGLSGQNAQIAKIPVYDEIKSLVEEVNNDDNKSFVGTPIVEFYTTGRHVERVWGPSNLWEFKAVAFAKAVVATQKTEIYDIVARRKGISKSELLEEIKKSQEPQLSIDALKNEGLTLDLLEQRFHLDKPAEILSEEDYITLPSGYQNGLNNTWIYHSVNNNLENILSKINTNETLEYIRQPRFLISFKTGQLNNLQLYLMTATSANITLFFDDKTKYRFNLNCGNKADETIALTNLVLNQDEEG